MDGSRRKSQVVGMDSANNQAECCPEPGCIDEDKEMASTAVSFVINGARKGTVHLCTRIAELLRENRRLKRTVEAQRAHIRLLRNSRAQACTSSCCSTPSLSVMQDVGTSSSCSSGRGSLSPGFHLPGLPPSASHRRTGAMPTPERNESLILQIPFLHPCPNSPASSRRHGQDGTIPHSDGRVFRRSPHETLGADRAMQRTQRKHKQREKNTSTTHTEDMRFDEDLARLSLNQMLPPPDRMTNTEDSRDLSRGQGYTKAEHCMKLNHRVILDTKQKGTIRFIGHLVNNNMRDVCVGVELDSACGENDGTFNGTRYFKCRANHGTFTTLSHIKQSSRPQTAQPCSPGRGDSSDSDRGSPSSRTPNTRLHRTRNQMNISAVVHSEMEPRVQSGKSNGSP